MERDLCMGRLTTEEMMVVGTTMILVASRARFTDPATAHELTFNDDIFELAITETKTSRDPRLPKWLIGPLNLTREASSSALLLAA